MHPIAEFRVMLCSLLIVYLFSISCMHVYVFNINIRFLNPTSRHVKPKKDHQIQRLCVFLGVFCFGRQKGVKAHVMDAHGSQLKGIAFHLGELEGSGECSLHEKKMRCMQDIS